MLEQVLLWGPVLAAAATLLLVSTYARGHRTPTAGPDGDPSGAPRDSRVHVACHSPECGHLERPHDATTSGLICSRCGRNASQR
ncbi:hypothetical protein ACFV6Z_18535 [Streptomyces sp. NPDC059818]|uniref:hypothetical protein n=1 Tax=Streptomyces sp. NPDC059818 TaxID=3346962 RepID=UPI0036595810